ncbi:hypothetical protein TOTORO_02500 [Serratia phage vB_SmaS-Totoro]|nr:hypothetical protein TOTORO_02500 [Serratia phage vB_SmaS-Totoro]
MGKIKHRLLRLVFFFALAYITGHAISMDLNNPILILSLLICWATVFINNILND